MCRRKELAHHLANVPCLLCVRKVSLDSFGSKALARKPKLDVRDYLCVYDVLIQTPRGQVTQS